MSSYFDDIDEQIRNTRGNPEASDLLRQIEEKLVFDVTVATELPGFPADLAVAVHEVVLRHGVYSLPAEAEPRDFETEDDHRRFLFNLSGDLHSIFHAVGHRCFPELSDNPLTGLRKIFDRADLKRSAMVEDLRWDRPREAAADLQICKGPDYGIVDDVPREWWVKGKSALIWFDPNGLHGYWKLEFGKAGSRYFRHEAEALRICIDYWNHHILGAS